VTGKHSVLYELRANGVRLAELSDLEIRRIERTAPDLIVAICPCCSASAPRARAGTECTWCRDHGHEPPAATKPWQPPPADHADDIEY
jgi:hypothetical protein